MNDIERLKNMKSCSDIKINWSECGGGMVYRVWDVWILWEVPMYGGEPRYEGTFFESTLGELVSIANQWT